MIGELLIVCCLAVLISGQPLLTVQVMYPHENLMGSALFLRGDNLGLNWTSGAVLYPLERDENMWVVQLPIQNAGQVLSMKSLIDDQTWQIGANFQVLIPSVSSTITIYPFFKSYKGTYTYIRNIFSQELNNTRDLVVYTPPSYLENTLKVYNNVLIMHDGQNLFNDSTSFAGISWKCQKTVNELVALGGMDEIIIVGIDNTANRIGEYTYSADPQYGGGQGDIYLNFIESTVLPLIQQTYRINDPSTWNLGILGSSLGGLISCYAGWTRPKIYSRAGCMSSSFWWNNEDFNTVIMPTKTQPPTSIAFYLDSGDAGQDNDDETQTITVRDHFIKLGWQINQTLGYYLDHGGQHNEYYWGQRFHVPMAFLFPNPINQAETD